MKAVRSKAKRAAALELLTVRAKIKALQDKEKALKTQVGSDFDYGVYDCGEVILSHSVKTRAGSVDWGLMELKKGKAFVTRLKADFKKPDSTYDVISVSTKSEAA